MVGLAKTIFLIFFISQTTINSLLQLGVQGAITDLENYDKLTKKDDTLFKTLIQLAAESGESKNSTSIPSRFIYTFGNVFKMLISKGFNGNETFNVTKHQHANLLDNAYKSNLLDIKKTAHSKDATRVQSTANNASGTVLNLNLTKVDTKNRFHGDRGIGENNRSKRSRYSEAGKFFEAGRNIKQPQDISERYSSGHINHHIFHGLLNNPHRGMYNPYRGRMYGSYARKSVPGNLEEDSISQRFFLYPQDSQQASRMHLEELPVPRRLKPIKMSNGLRSVYNERGTEIPMPYPKSRSVRVHRRMRKVINKVKSPKLNLRNIRDKMKVHTGNEVLHGSEPEFRCKAGTNGVLSIRDGKTISSRGLSYSEVDGSGIKSLLCRSQTSETYKPDENTYVRNAVSGLNVITTDTDPFKFLEHRNGINNEILEIGSRAISTLDATSKKNQSVSVVTTHDKNASSHSRASTKFKYENGTRTGFETGAEIQGSTSFNVPSADNPLVLTSKQEETSSILRNPSVSGESSTEEENDSIATFINYRKKTDFNIAFRNLFDI